MNREQMIAWLTLEGWVPSCSIADDPFDFFIKRMPPEMVRIVVYDASRHAGRERPYYQSKGPYSRGSEVDLTHQEWEQMSDAQVKRAYEEANL